MVHGVAELDTTEQLKTNKQRAWRTGSLDLNFLMAFREELLKATFGVRGAEQGFLLTG